jgi:hypothetical protein
MSDNPNTHGQARPRFDPTINCGEVLTVSSFLIAAASLLRKCSELQNVDLRVAKIENTHCNSRVRRKRADSLA